MRIFNIVFFCCTISSLFASSIGTCGEYPQHIETIDESMANYLTPENTVTSLRSALLAGNLDWADQSITNESLQEQKILLENAHIDRSKLIELERNTKESFIVNKLSYNDAVVLIIQAIGFNGSTKQVPVTLVTEGGLWKISNKYKMDKELQQYLHYVPPLFNGKGQKPDEVNSFLGYTQPTTSQTDLATGTAGYMIHLYYGQTVDPTTFAAEINQQDITSKFTPKPFTDEEVEIPLRQGHNTLTLSIAGTKKNGQIATDKDNLVFVVP